MGMPKKVLSVSISQKSKLDGGRCSEGGKSLLFKLRLLFPAFPRREENLFPVEILLQPFSILNRERSYFQAFPRIEKQIGNIFWASWGELFSSSSLG